MTVPPLDRPRFSSPAVSREADRQPRSALVGDWFCVGWALAVIFHLLANPAHLLQADGVGLGDTVLAALALALLAYPCRAVAVGLGLAQVVVLVAASPMVGNHEVILTLVGMVMAFSALRGGPWVVSALPALRWVLLVSYGWIAFSKLNTGFLDPSVSCAVVFGDEFGRWLSTSVSDSAALSGLVIVATLAAECSIPILLLIRRTRAAGVALGLVFHFVLAAEPLSHVWDFTAVLLPLFLLFAPDRARDGLDRLIGSVRRRVAPRLLAGWGLVLIGVDALVVIRGESYLVVPYVLWTVYGGSVVSWYLWSQRPDGGRRPVPATIGRPAGLLVVPIVVAMANGLSPYLELRTAGAFNMYSNLETAQGRTNHLLVPATLPLRSTEVFSVRDAPDDDPLAVYDDAGLSLPGSNLWLFAADGGRSEATLVSPRQQGSLDELVLDPVDPFTARFGFLRAVDQEGPMQCLRQWGPAH